MKKIIFFSLFISILLSGCVSTINKETQSIKIESSTEQIYNDTNIKVDKNMTGTIKEFLDGGILIETSDGSEFIVKITENTQYDYNLQKDNVVSITYKEQDNLNEDKIIETVYSINRVASLL